MKIKNVRPDSKGRIMLGKIAKGISSFDVQEVEYGVYSLIANVEMPAKERWIYENKAVARSLKKGMKQAKTGEVISRGSFAKHLDD
jgi:hypothetical protein